MLTIQPAYYEGAIDRSLTYGFTIDTIPARIRSRTPATERSMPMEREKVKVSPKFQIVIPKSLREEMKIEAGQELLIYSVDGALRLVPHRSVKELRGIAKGMRWKEEYRDNPERF
ncbi:MAG TPA: AbrB/MazE/SpoVT family DNA-binding domain-containing protein [Verrucomicrobiae bacterium]|nr:AbrB/MazE/SpoVT family DNA-binding domain-containing protein [Verrucomicrobiae bacterium]